MILIGGEKYGKLVFIVGMGFTHWHWHFPFVFGMKDYPAIENLIPLTLILSVLGLGIAWRWEGLGGAINIGFYLANIVVHFWIISLRPYPYLIAIALPIPGILFLVCWWMSRKNFRFKSQH